MLSRVLELRILLVSGLMAASTVAMFALELAQGADLDTARTMAFTALVLFQIFNALNARSENQSVLRSPFSNRILTAGLAAGVLLQLLVIYLPPIQPIMRTAPLDAAEWGLVVAVSASVLVLVELEKLIRSRTLSPRAEGRGPE